MQFKEFKNLLQENFKKLTQNKDYIFEVELDKNEFLELNLTQLIENALNIHPLDQCHITDDDLIGMIKRVYKVKERSTIKPFWEQSEEYKSSTMKAIKEEDES